MAKAACWKFDVDFKDLRDSVVFEGSGVSDLNRLIATLEGPAVLRPKVLCDVGKLFSSYVIVSVDDVYALRQRYIEVYGTVDKPQIYYAPRPGSAVEVTGTVGVEPTPHNIPFYSDEFQDFGDGRGPIGPHTPPDQLPGI
jgi:hypothetical protein